MRRVLQFLIFILIFLSISVAINLYIFFRLSAMLELSHSLWFWLGLGLSSISFLFSMFFDFKNLLSRVTVIVASIWLGIIAICLFIIIGVDIVGLFIPIDQYIAGITIIIMTGILSLSGIVNAQYIRIREIEIKTSRLKHDLRLVHLSDLHLGSINGIGYYSKIVKRVRALKPDLILITGDLIDNTEHFTNGSLSILDELGVPVFITAGNHEFYAGLREVSAVLKGQNIRVIRNETIDSNNVQIIGIDYTPMKRQFLDALDKVRIDPNKYTILMHHQPMALEDVNDRGIDLMVAGHTHGGQIFMFTVLAWLIWKYPNGLYRYRDTYLNTSSGTGTWGPPMRLGSNNEIVLIKLKSVNGQP